MALTIHNSLARLGIFLFTTRHFAGDESAGDIETVLMMPGQANNLITEKDVFRESAADDAVCVC